MQKIINFTGAQGTGKTTILKALQQDPAFKEFDFVTEVVRNFVKEKGLKINQDGTTQTQELLFQAYSDSLEKKTSYVSDRCIIDVCAYTEDGCARNKKDPAWRALLQEQFNEVKSLKEKLGYVFYFPIEFPLVNDGVRSMNEEYQEWIDKYICNVLQLCDIPYTVVSGTVEQRIRTIKSKVFNW